MADRSRIRSFFLSNVARWTSGILAAASLAGASAVDAQPRPLNTEPIATVVGRYAPEERRLAGVYGSDLGWTFEHDGKLWVLFGDTWRADADGERDMGLEALADDALGFISLSANGGFPNGQAVEAFIDAPASGPAWRAASPTITFAPQVPNRENRATPNSLAGPMRPVRGGWELPSTPAQTPVAGFSNARQGAASGAFAIFLQNEKLLCGNWGTTCDKGYECATDIGVCIALDDKGKLMEEPLPFAQPCVIGSPSRPPYCARCDATLPPNGGMCVDKGSSVYDDSNLGKTAAVARIHQVGNARKDNPLKFDSQNWITQRFFNLASRTVSDFDRNRANGAGNDYRVADGMNPEREVVFLWGRPNFGGAREPGRDAQLYFAYVPLPNYNRNGRFPWQPQYFTGLSSTGAPMFTTDERRAVPLDLDAAQAGVQPEEHNDMVGQMSVAWIQSLNRWVMFYGGGMGTVFGELIFGEDRANLDESKVGPIYVRYAEQPWGPWTAPQPLFDPRNQPTYQYGSGGILFSSQCQAEYCAESETAWPDDKGGLYAPDIIDPWTTVQADGSTTLYWHVSTWNPYQVVLMRTNFAAR